MFFKLKGLGLEAWFKHGALARQALSSEFKLQ
jgi:hypothetical protein